MLAAAAQQRGMAVWCGCCSLLSICSRSTQQQQEQQQEQQQQQPALTDMRRPRRSDSATSAYDAGQMRSMGGTAVPFALMAAAAAVASQFHRTATPSAPEAAAGARSDRPCPSASHCGRGVGAPAWQEGWAGGVGRAASACSCL